MATRKENIKKINAELEKMSDEELEAVAGGTVGEFEELTKAIVSNPTLKKLGGFDSHVPALNGLLANQVEKFLQDNLQIDADISLGFLGTGAGSKNNKYVDMTTGKYISHEEVLKRIESMG